MPYHHQQCIEPLVASPKSFRERTEKFESSRVGMGSDSGHTGMRRDPQTWKNQKGATSDGQANTIFMERWSRSQEVTLPQDGGESPDPKRGWL
ncbi:hypothetical protein LAZ67_21001602 [Cordylochernes scorpioides]|uniref:Uncharacterized protein n=1 Tax=Cordylochernes scorpioides TaxID=51811 RepID=A0ABY6LM85_9ARAC|nr:hypothetical protein LAZ67_21001602 [Cordylochernes scorpioides]